jgi:hypothetical protein
MYHIYTLYEHFNATFLALYQAYDIMIYHSKVLFQIGDTKD